MLIKSPLITSNDKLQILIKLTSSLNLNQLSITFLNVVSNNKRFANITEKSNSTIKLTDNDKKLDNFESDLKEWFQIDYLLTTNSATSAEHLAFHMLKKQSDNVKIFDGAGSYNSHWSGLKDGDEVLCTPLTCTATNWPVLANNFNIKWVDVDENTLNMNLDDLERKITPNTKAIYLVHWGGYPVDLNRVRELQLQTERMYGFKPVVIEDCAHAFGSEYNGKKIGTHGNICTFSFQAIKHLTSVDGGVLIVPHKELFDRGKLLRWYGIDRENTSRKDFRCEEDVKEWGFKFHMNDVNAAVGIENLKLVDKNIAIHKSNGTYYNEHLKDVDGVTVLEHSIDRSSSYWIYTIRVERQADFMKMMAGKGIMVSRVHERNDQHTCVFEYRRNLPTLDRVVKEMICIPVGWWVSKEDREYIVNCIKEGW